MSGWPRLTIEHINQEFNAEGNTLLTTEYVNAHQKLKYVCSQCKQQKEISWNAFQRGQRCPCIKNNKRVLKMNDVFHRQMEAEGNILLSQFINSRSPVEYICGQCKQHRKTTWGKWQKGVRCPCLSNQAPITNEFAHQTFAAQGHILLSTYINAHTQMEYICCHCKQHRSTTWNNWQQGKRCHCIFTNKRITKKYEIFKQQMEAEGYKMLSSISDYINNTKHMKYECPNGHLWKITWGNWQNGNRCPECSMNGTSKGEIELQTFCFNWFQENRQNVEILFNNRKMIYYPETKRFLEIDMLIPELKIAIEYGAYYYHGSPQHPNYKNIIKRDVFKKQWLKDNGWRHLVIKEEEWKKNKDFNMILEFING